MRKGFTLIELLAVIVILAVIALISVPLILGVIENSKEGAFKDSVSLTFSSAELYEAKNTISESGIEVKDLVMKNNNFKYGKIVKNANNELEAVNVSDGRYCAFGLLTNITIYKGECDTVNPLAPSVSVEDSIYSATKEYTLYAPSTMSGIDSYEYYLSDTTDTPSSDVVISGSSKTNKITINKVSKYVFFRVVSIANLKGDWSSAKINYVDLTIPTASLSTNTITSNSVTLAAICSDNESGIIKYEFSKDGSNYVDNNTNSAYTFDNLTSGTATYYVKCTNGANDKTIASVEATTVAIDTPTYSISPTGYATSKTLTVTYPSGYTNEYSINGGTSWLAYTAPVVFNANGNLIARVNDGTNYVTGSSYTVTNIDTTIPTVTTSVASKVGTLTLGDNLELSGYTVTTTATIPTVWTAITGTTSVQTYTASTAGTYYAWVKDVAGNTNNKTFVIDSTAFCAYTVGQTWNFAYNGGVQNFTVPCSATYKLEVYGAQGGYIGGTGGGLGGYSVGASALTTNQVLYIVVGGAGTSNSSNSANGTFAGGYNGGGQGISNTSVSGNGNNSAGGGATHIAKVTGTLGSIGYTSGVTNGNLLIVAGGGGGSAYDNCCGARVGGTGGGTTGTAGAWAGYEGYAGTAATQTSAGGLGSFGIGGSSSSSGSGGGGGLYGGGAAAYYSGGGGGSGYLSSLLTSASMANGLRTGNGYATITLVNLN